MSESVYLQKARENLAVAHWCLEQGHCNACVKRVYYAMFQSAIVALIQYGLTTEDQEHSHKWVQSTFASELVGRRKIFPGYQDHLMRVQRKRNVADYEAQNMSKKQTERLFKFGENFVNQILEGFNES